MTRDPNVLGWSPAAKAWLPLTVVSLFAADEASYTEPGLAADITTVVILDTPRGITSAGGFNTTPPTANITAAPPLTSIIRAVNSGGGDYTITFSQFTDRTAINALEPSLLIYSPGANAWRPMRNLLRLTTTTIIFSIDTLETDGTTVIMLSQLSNISSPFLFRTAVPQTVIP